MVRANEKTTFSHRDILDGGAESLRKHACVFFFVCQTKTSQTYCPTQTGSELNRSDSGCCRELQRRDG